MFSIGLSEILVISLVSIIAIDKDKLPAFLDLIRNIYRQLIIVKLKTWKLLKEAGIEDLCEQYKTEKINYIVGKDGKFYPSYSTNDTSKKDHGEDHSSR